MSEIPDDNTCHTPNHVWMQGCMTCFEERIRADEREKAAQRLNGCRTDLRGCVNKAPAIAAVLGMDEPRPPWATPADLNKWARNDMTNKTSKSAVTVHNIDNPDAIVNVRNAAVVNITQTQNVNVWS